MKLEFVSVCSTVLLAVFVCAWPADNLMYLVSPFTSPNFDFSNSKNYDYEISKVTFLLSEWKHYASNLRVEMVWSTSESTKIYIVNDNTSVAGDLTDQMYHSSLLIKLLLLGTRMISVVDMFHRRLCLRSNLIKYLIFQFITNVISMFTALRVVMYQDEKWIRKLTIFSSYMNYVNSTMNQHVIKYTIHKLQWISICYKIYMYVLS